MADDKTIALAKEIRDDLAKGNWSLKFDPQRTYRPLAELKDTDCLKVMVVLVTMEVTPDNRREWTHEHTIDIGIQFRAKPEAGEATEKFDECVKLQGEIVDFYKPNRVTVADLPLVAVELPNGMYVAEHMLKFNQFTGVIRLTFREWREPE